jgi:geranylgeranyl diphosphate synthase, type I
LNLTQALETYLPKVEDELRACLTPSEDDVPAFYGMLQYHMGWLTEDLSPVAAAKTGKRLRPVFLMLSCRAAGGEAETALPAAAAVEILHNFSLIHDDIQDQSQTRHGRRTVWNIWGEAQAINAGDAMFTLAHLALQRLLTVGLAPERLAPMFSVFDRTCLALCRGQHLDMAFEEQLTVDQDAYMRMIAGKTGALLGGAGELGAMVAGTETADKYRRFGEGLGLAFQIQDDVLGIWGETEKTGKPVADDIRSRKKTLPVVYVLDRGEDPAAIRLRQLYAQSELTEEDVREAITLLDGVGARDFAQALADRAMRNALDLLESAEPEAEAGEALRDLAAFLVQRAH